MGDDAIEYTLLNKKECMLYQIPPATAHGHKASDWQKCIWRGRLVITAKGHDMTIKFVHSSGEDLGKHFVEALVVNGESDKYVERTQDSSRYFAVRVNDPNSGRKAFLGLGFEDRNDAFDFNCTITDFKNRNEADSQVAAEPLQSKDYSLKEGEKICVNFKGLKTRTKKQPNDAEVGFLPPPPGASRRQDAGVVAPYTSYAPPSAPAAIAPPAAPAQPGNFEDDFFADFQSFQASPAPILFQQSTPASFQASPSPFQSAPASFQASPSHFQSAPAQAQFALPACLPSSSVPVDATVSSATHTVPEDFSSLTAFSLATSEPPMPTSASTQPTSLPPSLQADDPFDLFK